MRSLSIASTPSMHPAFLAMYTNTNTKKQLYAIIEQKVPQRQLFLGIVPVTIYLLEV
jgi:hypothetical protein